MLLVLPFVAAGFWRWRRDILEGPWLAPLIVLSVFYALWFLSGSSQRVRHLVPLYPVVLLICAYLAVRWSESAKAAWPLYLACVLSIGIQMAGHGASSLNYARHMFTGESRDAFYERNISNSAAVRWLNVNLTDSDKVLFINRQLNYLIDVPSYYAHSSNEVLIDIRPNADNPGRYLRQLHDLGVTHILATASPKDRPATKQDILGDGLWRVLLASGCAKEVARVPFYSIRSRSLSAAGSVAGWQLVLRLGPPACVLEGRSR